MVDKCPECNGDLQKAEIGTSLETTLYPALEFTVIYCLDCDWMTVDDWDRKEGWYGWEGVYYR